MDFLVSIWNFRWLRFHFVEGVVFPFRKTEYYWASNPHSKPEIKNSTNQFLHFLLAPFLCFSFFLLCSPKFTLQKKLFVFGILKFSYKCTKKFLNLGLAKLNWYFTFADSKNKVMTDKLLASVYNATTQIFCPISGSVLLQSEPLNVQYLNILDSFSTNQPHPKITHSLTLAVVPSGIAFQVVVTHSHDLGSRLLSHSIQKCEEGLFSTFSVHYLLIYEYLSTKTRMKHIILFFWIWNLNLFLFMFMDRVLWLISPHQRKYSNGFFIFSFVILPLHQEKFFEHFWLVVSSIWIHFNFTVTLCWSVLWSLQFFFRFWFQTFHHRQCHGLVSSTPTQQSLESKLDLMLPLSSFQHPSSCCFIVLLWVVLAVWSFVQLFFIYFIYQWIYQKFFLQLFSKFWS